LLGVKKKSLGYGILCSGTIICDSVSTSFVSVGSLFPVHCNEAVGASKQISFGCLLASFFFFFVFALRTNDYLQVSLSFLFLTCLILAT